MHAQVAQALEKQGRLQQAADWLERLCMQVPRDAAALAMLGSLHARLGSDSDAFRCCCFVNVFMRWAAMRHATLHACVVCSAHAPVCAEVCVGVVLSDSVGYGACQLLLASPNVPLRAGASRMRMMSCTIMRTP